MPERDLVVELLHYDADSCRLEHAIADGSAVVSEIEPLTHDIVRLVLKCDQEFAFTPGQYVDLHVPGDRDPPAGRSFSMANPPGEDLIELMIKRYPGGRLSGMLDGQIKVGDRLGLTGPYGAFRLRDGERPILMIAGGSGMAPILSVLRQLSADGCSRPVRLFYGARAERDLFHVEEIEELGARLPDFRFTPIVDNFVHNAVAAYLAEGEIAQPDVYMCGPPPMIEAAEEMLVATHGVDEQRIFTDKFTTAAEAAAPATPSIPAPGGSEREFDWYVPAGRHATLYEDVTIDTQPSVHRHLRRGWPVSFEDGRGTWDDGSTAVRAEDWFAFRDPGGQWERPFYQGEGAIEQQIEGAIRSATAAGLIDDFQPGWVDFLEQVLQMPAFVEHGLWFALATVARDCLSDSVATCVCLRAAMKQRSARRSARTWTIAFVRFACADQVHGDANREVITEWVRDWRAEASAAALALAPLAQQIPAGIDVEQALDRVEQYADALLVEAGLTDGPGAPPVMRRRTRVRRQRRHPTPAAATTTAATAPVLSPDSYDYVGIVMARSAEGGRRRDPRAPSRHRSDRATGVLGHPRQGSPRNPIRGGLRPARL